MTEKKRYEKPLVREYRLACTLPLLIGSGTGLPGGLDDGGFL